MIKKMFLATIFSLSLFGSTVMSQSWNCRNNDFEISCALGKCQSQESFTPMSVSFDEKGKMSVCAYSGCWEGKGKILKSGSFLTLIGNNLKFSTSSENTENIAVAFDKKDKVAVIKAGSFAHPLTCEKAENK